MVEISGRLSWFSETAPWAADSVLVQGNSQWQEEHLKELPTRIVEAVVLERLSFSNRHEAQRALFFSSRCPCSQAFATEERDRATAPAIRVLDRWHGIRRPRLLGYSFLFVLIFVLVAVAALLATHDIHDRDAARKPAVPSKTQSPGTYVMYS